METGEHVPGDDDPVEWIGVYVGIAVHVDVTLGAAERGGHLEQIDAAVRRHVAGRTIHDLAVARAVEQRRHPQLQVQAGGDEQIGVAQDPHEARLRLHEVGVLVALRDRGDGAAVAHDLASDGAVGRETR